PSWPGTFETVTVNAAHDMVSQCRSPKSALIRCRELLVPPLAIPPGVLVAVLLPFPRTVTPGAAEIAVPWKVTVGPDACAGANSINPVGLVIFVAAIATLLT